MTRTNPQAVRAILMRDYDTDLRPSLTPFIDTASVIVDNLVAAGSAHDISYTDTKLEIIERWLAAHCYVQSDQTFSEKQTSNAFALYQGRTGMRLEDSKYGQTALSLDSSGLLASVTNTSTVRAFWLGKRPSQQIPYGDRS